MRRRLHQTPAIALWLAAQACAPAMVGDLPGFTAINFGVSTDSNYEAPEARWSLLGSTDSEFSHFECKIERTHPRLGTVLEQSQYTPCTSPYLLTDALGIAVDQGFHGQIKVRSISKGGDTGLTLNRPFRRSLWNEGIWQGNTSGLGYLVATLGAQSFIGGEFQNVLIRGKSAVTPSLAQLSSDGAIDLGFRVTGGLTISTFSTATVYASILQPDGKTIFGGDFWASQGDLSYAITRLLPDGSRDPSFTSPFIQSTVTALLYQPNDGKIIVSGALNQAPSTASTIARLNTDGSIDTSFAVGSGFDDAPAALALESSGKIIAGGNFIEYSGASSFRIIRLQSNGLVDPSFVTGSGFNGSVFALFVQSDGKIIVGGNFTLYNGGAASRIIRLNPDGSVDPSFVTGSGFDQSVRALLVQNDGKIIVGGNFTLYNGGAASRIIRLNPDGSVDPSFVTGSGFGGGIVRTLLAQTDGQILVGGSFLSYNGESTPLVVRIKPGGARDATLDIGSGFGGLSAGSNHVYSLLLRDDGKILVSGKFTTYNAREASRFYRLGPEGAEDPSFTGLSSGFNGLPLSIAKTQSGQVIVGGAFTTYNGVSSPYLVQMNADGSRDSSFNSPGFNSPINAILPQVDQIIVAGEFTTCGGSTVNRIARLNADGTRDSNWNTSGSGFDEYVSVLARQADGAILVGGDFTEYNGLAANKIIRLLPDGSRDTSFGVGSGFNGEVKAIQIQNDGKILVAGTFSSYQATFVGSVVRLNPDGSRDSSFVTGSGKTSGSIEALALQSDGKILVGGFSLSYGWISKGSLFRLTSSGMLDPSFDLLSGFNGTVRSLALEQDGTILVGGSFGSFRGSRAPGFLRLSPDGLRN